LNESGPSSWLAADVGNSQIKFGCFPAVDSTGSPESPLPECRQFFCLKVDDEIPWPEILAGCGQASGYQGVVAGSNQVGVDRLVDEWPKTLSAPLVIRSPERFPLVVDVDEPARVGLDRLLNAIAANRIRRKSTPAIIVDCGTATTVDVVSETGAFSGGAILPGFTLCARALHRYTEVLPLISLEELFALPVSEDTHPALGKNTHEAIRSGVFWGQIGAIRELVDRLCESACPGRGEDRDIDLLITGGGARLLVPHLPDAVHCPSLPLQGLVLAALNDPAS